MSEDEGEAPVRRHVPQRVRLFLFRAVLVFFALTWLTFGFGVIDFVSGFTSPGPPDFVDVAVLSTAYGAIAGIVLPLAFLAQLRAPNCRPAALLQIAVVAIAFTVAGVLGLDPLSFISVGTLVVMLAVLWFLHPARPPLLPDLRRRPRRRALVLCGLAAIPWLAYAIEMAANSRLRIPPDDLAARPQAGGWAGACAMALCVILLGLLSCTQARGWRVPLWSAALTSFAFGVVSLLHLDSPGSVGRLGGALAAAWGLVLVLACELPVREVGQRGAAGAEA